MKHLTKYYRMFYEFALCMKIDMIVIFLEQLCNKISMKNYIHLWKIEPKFGGKGGNLLQCRDSSSWKPKSLDSLCSFYDGRDNYVHLRYQCMTKFNKERIKTHQIDMETSWWQWTVWCLLLVKHVKMPLIIVIS